MGDFSSKINDTEDQQLARNFNRRQKYFLDNGLKPLWLIDLGNLAVEEKKRGIVLWEMEWLSSLITTEDKEWTNSLMNYTSKTELFKAFGYLGSDNMKEVSVRSVYYISQEDDTNKLRVLRYVDDRVIRPFRGFLIGETYSISIANALQIESESFLLADELVEKGLREKMKESFFEANKARVIALKEESLKRVIEKLELEEAKRILRLREEEYSNRKILRQNESNKENEKYGNSIFLNRPKSNLSSEDLEKIREVVRRANFKGTEEEFQNLKKNLVLRGTTW